MSPFKPEELISKNGKTYPVVGGRLRIAHEDNDNLSIITDLVQFEPMSHASVRATITTIKGTYSAYGVASVQKDERLVDSLLELAETRAIARALRFSGYGVEYTGVEEIPENQSQPFGQRSQEVPPSQKRESRQWPEDKTQEFVPATRPQIHAIEKIATLKRWNAVECCRRILHESNISSIEELSKDQASEVIGRMKEAA